MSESPLWLAIKARNKARRQKVNPLMMKRLEDRVEEEAHKLNKALGTHGHAMIRSLNDVRLAAMVVVEVRLPKELLVKLRGIAALEGQGESGEVGEVVRRALQAFVDRWVREQRKQRRAEEKAKR